MVHPWDVSYNVRQGKGRVMVRKLPWATLGDPGGGRTTASCSEIVEGAGRGRPAGDSLEDDVAHGQVQDP